jgi:acyl carrier protein
MAIGLSHSVKSAFPASAVAQCLRDELIAAVESVASREGKTLPTNTSDMLATPVEIDSLVVVELLSALDDLVGFELPESVVRAGGYRTVGEAIGDLMPRIEAVWQRKRGGGAG